MVISDPTTIECMTHLSPVDQLECMTHLSPVGQLEYMTHLSPVGQLFGPAQLIFCPTGVFFCWNSRLGPFWPIFLTTLSWISINVFTRSRVQELTIMKWTNIISNQADSRQSTPGKLKCGSWCWVKLSIWNFELWMLSWITFAWRDHFSLHLIRCTIYSQPLV